MAKIQNAGAIIQARVGSTRLPGKSLIKISGKTVLQQVIERVKKAKHLQKVIVAVPDTQENKVLKGIIRKSGAECFAGNEENVLDRFIKAARKFEVNPVVRVCADSPLIDARFIDLALEQHFMEKNDYTSSVGVLPSGLDFEIVSLESLEKEAAVTNKKEHLEHVTLFIKENLEKFRHGFLHKGKELYRKELKLTLDTQADLDMLLAMQKELKKPLGEITPEEVISLFDIKKELFNNCQNQ
jgi:spore coat polysaccharide biosynthesis protein SpsF